MNNRQTQMMWLLVLTSISLVPVYVLLGWQSGGHSPQEITQWLVWFWRIEASAWGLRALVEAWALIYLFQTVTDNSRVGKVLIGFEIALISLIALTVGLVIISNGSQLSIAQGLPAWLYWVWSFSVATFAPLMMGSVGLAFKVHKPNSKIATTNSKVTNAITTPDSSTVSGTNTSTVDTTTRRHRILSLKSEGITQKQMAEMLGVSISTIRNDIKQLNGKVQ